MQTHLEAILNSDAKLQTASSMEASGELDLLATLETGRGRGELLGTAATTVATLAQSRADLPPNVARQIAEAMLRGPDRPIEVSLSPAELGSVRIKLSPADVGMVVSVFAERPETLDLLRRNIETLGQAISDLGYDDVAFDFSTNAGSPSFEEHADGESEAGDTTMQELERGDEGPRILQRQAYGLGGLDVRV